MNTAITYQYRDADNYKNFEDIVVKGQLDYNDLKPFLHEGEFFIPSEVGLCDLQPEPFFPCDHIWHTIISVSDVSEKPGCDITSKDLKTRFRTARAQNWNEQEVFKRKGLL